ncbi:MAG: hypothetical protein R3E97_21545 [Candidatus Eisenbacteria bacterium]
MHLDSRPSIRPLHPRVRDTACAGLYCVAVLSFLFGCGSGDDEESAYLGSDRDYVGEDYTDADYAGGDYADAGNAGADFADTDYEDTDDADARYARTYDGGSGPGGSGSEYATPQPRGGGRGGQMRGTERVVLFDRSLNMPRAAVEIPAGWRVYQDIATDPSTGTSARFQVDFVGPNDELIRGVRALNYFSMAGQSLESAWRHSADIALQGTLERLEVGRLGPSDVLSRTRLVRDLSQRVRVQALEAPVRGVRNGVEFAGAVYVVNMPTPQDPNSGTVMVEALLAPAASLDQVREIHFRIAESREDNPQYQQAAAEMSQRAIARDRAQSQQWMAQSQAAHQQRMASNQAQFDAHQQRMQSQSQSFDQMNQQWMSDFRSSGGSAWAGGGGDGYGGHEAFIDQIYEQQSFADPYSGQQMQMDGQYDYNYTNGLGDYYRTDDPNFDPNSLSGDWQAIDPMNPNR